MHSLSKFKRSWAPFSIGLFAILASCSRPAELPKLAPLPDGQPFTFAVIGDYRGDSEGNPPAVLLDIFEAINRDNPAFVLSTGDLINGYPEEDEAQTRKLWNGYRTALQKLKPPIFHVPGNHDIFNDVSARLWRKFLGPTYYAFDYAGVRFVGLDSETTRGRIAGKQLTWLRRQLDSAKAQRLFVFCHQPLFPVDGHIGSSLDAFPTERDELHRLLLAQRPRLAAVFLGHEHLFHFERRDGVPYYISAGSGAPLYVPRELGGFFHYLLVHVSKESCAVELRKMWNAEPASQPPRVIKPAELLEDWDHRNFWSAWDQTVEQELVSQPVSDGHQALKLSFNLAHYEWPALSTTFPRPLDLRAISHLKFDVFVPDGTSTELAVTGALESYLPNESKPVPLRRGWNTIDLDLNGGWVTPAVRKGAHTFRIAFTGPRNDTLQTVVIDNLRTDSDGDSESAAPSESWEASLQWAISNDSARPGADDSHATQNTNAVIMPLDFAQEQRPTLYSELHPPWDLSEVKEMTVDVNVPTKTDLLSLHLAITGALETCQSPGIPLRRGAQTVSVPLDWIVPDVRRDARRIEWWLTSTGGASVKGAVVIDNLRSGR